MKKLIITAVCVCCAMAAIATTIPDSNGVADLTKGGKLTRINARWIGPLGIKCGFWRPRGQKQEDCRQFLVMEIDEGSPADGVLAIGDVILGADGTGAAKVPLFKGASWPVILFGDPVAEAEARNPALLKLLISRPAGTGASALATDPKQKASNGQPVVAGHRDGKLMTVTIKLETLGRYSDTAPYNCPKSKAILRKGIKKLYEDNKPDKVGLSMLCLLAADDPTNPDNDKYQARAKEWAHQIGEGDGPWFSGPKLIALSEYYMKTKDESIFPKLVRQAEHHARGVSWFGTTGHRWAEKKPDGSLGGRLGGYGPIGASGVQGLAGLSLARRAGVKSPLVESANKAQRIFFGHYAFRGRPSYGEFFYEIGGGSHGDNNAKCAMTALALGMEENQETKAKYFTRMSMLSTPSDRIYAHGGSFFAQCWNPIGAAQGGVKAANLHFKANRWHLELKRRWDYSRIYDSSGNGYKDFDSHATGLLFYALPLKQLYVTGRGQKESLKFSDAEFAAILADRDFDVSKASNEELMAALSRTLWVSTPAELAKRIIAKPDDAESTALIDQLIAVAADSKATPGARTRACDALRKFKDRAREPLASLKNEEIVKTGIAMLKDPNPYVRFGAAKLLQKINPGAVRPHAGEIMDGIIATGRPAFPLDEDDPLQAAHSTMGQLLFENVLGTSLDGVDRKKLIRAAHSLFHTPNAFGRNSAGRVLEKLSMEEVLELADAIVYNTRYAAPANAMGGTGYMVASRKVLAEHLFEEGLPLALIYGGGSAVKDKILEKYGRAAFSMHSTDKMLKSIGDMMLVGARFDANAVVEQMQKIPAPEYMPKLKIIKSVKAGKTALTLPAAATELVVDARNYAFPNEGDTTYTWRKVYGAGKVTFTPNAQGKSRTTTVSFTDKKPGKYRFEVTMSDVLGYTEVRKTVDVVLYDKKGKLPGNKPPQAKSMAFRAVAGRSGLVRLTGTDPDGDDLGFAITKQPEHGTLSGSGSRQIYTARFGFNGIDSFTFDAIDGQGEKASGTIHFKVSDKDVGVAIYEGFDYPTGTVIGRTDGKSFGFDGPWKDSLGHKPPEDRYWVEQKQESLTYASLPATGGKLTRSRWRKSIVRALDPETLATHKLLDGGSELWFSLYMVPPAGNLYSSFSLYGKDISLGFSIIGQKGQLYATYNGGKVGESRGYNSRSQHLRGLNSTNQPTILIGRCTWGKTDTDKDRFEIFRVFDAPEFGPMLVEKPIAVFEQAIPQKNITGICNGSYQDVDEIRIGTTLHSVMVGTKPLKTASAK